MIIRKIVQASSILHQRIPAPWKERGLAVLPGLEDTPAGLDETSYQAFKVARGQLTARAIILTPPKAGTYLLAKMLENLELADLEIHLAENLISDYRGMTVQEKIDRARLVSRKIPLVVATRMIQPGQFAVGHIPCTDETRCILAPFVRILCLRDIRHALISFMRFERRRIAADPLRHSNDHSWAREICDEKATSGFLEMFGADYLAQARNMLEWSQEPGTIACRFEELTGDRGRTVQTHAAEAIADRVGAKPGTGLQALSDALGRSTLTWSGRRSTLDGYWDRSVEVGFRRLGGPEVNVLLGYPEDVASDV